MKFTAPKENGATTLKTGDGQCGNYKSERVITGKKGGVMDYAALFCCLKVKNGKFFKKILDKPLKIVVN